MRREFCPNNTIKLKEFKRKMAILPKFPHINFLRDKLEKKKKGPGRAGRPVVSLLFLYSAQRALVLALG